MTEYNNIEKVIKIYDDTIDILNQVLIGQAKVKKVVASAILCDTNSKILLTGKPGMGKTILSKFLAQSFNYKRIQVDSEMLPSDIQEYLKNKKDLNFLIVDEFNRASGRLQSAFIELFEENQITINGETESYNFNDFYVLATQNNTEIAGIFNVPQAIYDRFDVNIYFDDLTLEEKRQILFNKPNPKTAIQSNMILKNNVEITKKAVDNFIADKKDEDVMMEIVKIIDGMTMKGKSLFASSNVRAHEFALKLAKLSALVAGRDYILPTDFVDFVNYVYMHRIDQNIASIDDNRVIENFKEAKQKIREIKRKRF